MTSIKTLAKAWLHTNQEFAGCASFIIGSKLQFHAVSMSPGLLPSPVYPKFVWLQKDKTKSLRLVFKLQNINMQHTPAFCQDTWTSGKEACWELEARLAQCWANASKFLSSRQFFQIVFLSLRDEAIWRPASMFISFVTCRRCKSNFLNRISPRNYIAEFWNCCRLAMTGRQLSDVPGTPSTLSWSLMEKGTSHQAQYEMYTYTLYRQSTY